MRKREEWDGKISEEEEVEKEEHKGRTNNSRPFGPHRAV